MAATHICRVCNGERPHNGKHCLGCGTEVIRCKPATVQRTNQSCPGCGHCGTHTVLEVGRACCRKCQTVFEAPDFGYLDDRPDVNFDKKLLEMQRRKRGL